MKRIYAILSTVILGVLLATAQSVEYIPFGHFDQWVTRNIKESKMLGGHEKTVYEIGPTQTINGSKPYTNLGGSPWATSNVLASPMGIVKTSNAVYPDTRSNGGKCAKLATQFEECKVMGMINMEVMVTGTIFLGQMIEPIKSTKNPYSKMEMGIPFTKRPQALVFDYKLLVPNTNERVYSSGFGKKKTYEGSDRAEVMVLLQRRWEENGHIYAKRIGTARQRFNKTTDWVDGYHLPIHYGELTDIHGDEMGLIPKENSYYAHNSKGKLVPVEEVGWDNPDATPTHVIVMFSSGSGTAYIGTPGLTLWVDNVGWMY